MVNYFELKNNASSILVSGITDTATTITVVSGEGVKFPSTGVFPLTIWDDSNHPDPGDDSDHEIVWGTNTTGDVITITRAKESTSGFAHLIGARVSQLITVGIFDDPTYGIKQGSSGDMEQSTYDPTAVGADAFDMDNFVEGANTKILTSAERTVLGNTSGTNTGDAPPSDVAYDGTTWNANTDSPTKNAIRDKIEVMDTAIAANTSKNTNATHTGEVTGSGALTVDKTAMSNKSVVTAAGGDYILIGDTSDADNLKKILVSDITGGVGTVSLWLAAAAADLPQSDFTLTGTVTLTNGSTAVTGSGTAYDTELKVGDYIKRDSDGSQYWAKISAIASATALTIDANYGGTNGASAGSGSGRPCGYSYVLGTGESIGYGQLAFDDTAKERAGWRIPLPDVATTMSLKIYWKQASTGAASVVFNVGIKGVNEGENITTLSMPTVSDTIIDATQNNITYLSIAVDASVASNASDDEMVIFVLEVDAPHASHTLVGDANVFGVYAEYTRV